jgi:hypothetical protein
MDQEHQDHLNRILANRRSRGVPTPGPSVAASPIAVRQASPSQIPTSPVASSQPRGMAASGTTIQMTQGRSSSVSSATPANLEGGILPPRGAFDNFRQKPFIVSNNIRPYKKELTGNGRAPSPGKAAKVAAEPTVVGPPVRTLKNPFRAQAFEDFCQAPIYDPPITVQQLTAPREMAANPYAAGHQAPVVEVASAPQFDMQASLEVMSKGDWFLKWTRSQEVHRRYVWLDLSRGVVSWATVPNASFFLQSHVRLEDITEILTQCIVDDSDGRTYYKMVIVTTERALAIGTEMREKFDVWVDAIQRLCESQKTYTNHLLGRHASMYKVDAAPRSGFAFAPQHLPSGE